MPKYRPGLNDFDDDEVVDRFQQMSPDQIATLGLAIWYLHSAPDRRRNQCVAACLVLEECARRLDMPAHVLGASLEVTRKVDGVVTSHALEALRVTPQGVFGHAVLFLGDRFIDPTVGQFPEVRAVNGAYPVSGRVPAEDRDLVLERGGQVVVVTGTQREVSVAYSLTSSASVADALNTARAQDPAGIHRQATATLSNFVDFLAIPGLMDASRLPTSLQSLVAAARSVTPEGTRT